MAKTVRNLLWPCMLPALFLIYSLPLFVRVYGTTQMVIDEEFHLRQGLHFCNKRFDVWDNKITTFPGLYLFSLILNPFNFCTVLGLRLISLIAASINVALLYILRKSIFKKCGVENDSLAALEAFTIAALPPLYFFSHLYYTDTLSLTTVLLFYIYWQQKSHLQAAVFAAASVLMRQTNVVWVVMACASTVLNIIQINYAKLQNLSPRLVNIYQKELWLELFTNVHFFFLCLWHILKQCCFYMIIIFPFLGFILLNGSIVLGDKRAHVATLHIPQIFYFSVFTCLFALTSTLNNAKKAVRTILRHKRPLIVILILLLIIVHYNTLVHPYLLADNRHYSFYIWQRFYGRYKWFKYLMCPIYLFNFIVMYHNLQHLPYHFTLTFYVALFLILCFQRLLEFRYFLIPFVIYRLNLRSYSSQSCTPAWLELGIYVAINAFTFYTFFTKEIYWNDFKEPQRIIW